VVSNDDETVVGIFIVPSPQRGDHVLAINSAKRPHVDQYNFVAQVSDP
jgi:hypothetical protein